MDFKSDPTLQNEVDRSTSKNELITDFTTQQTDSTFILTSILKGYERRDIKIEINEDGSRMTISGEKPNNSTRRRGLGFNKTFIIPEGVVLNKVKARFDDDESRLTIRMPKSVKGLTGSIGVQEFKDPTSLLLQNQGSSDPKEDAQNGIQSDEVEKIQSQNQDSVEKMEEEEEEKNNNIQEAKPPGKCFITYAPPTPIIVGSTLLASLIVVFFTIIRSRNQSTKKTN